MAIELLGDVFEAFGAERTEVGALAEVLAQRAVDASMSSGGLMADYVVLPGRLIGGHRPVNDVEEVALQDPSRTAGAFGSCMASAEFLRVGVPSLLHDGGGVEHAIETAVPAAMQA